ncbi:MAG: class IV adenylate cyclase [Pseudomonadota bacterium]
MEPLEIEVKFHTPAAETIRQQIIAIGAAGHGRVFESNATYDDGTQSLKDRGMLLRLRRTQDLNTLTLKAPAATVSNEYKIMKELESAISDPGAIHNILETLGFRIWRRYEKWRETFRLDDVTFCLDTMPFGDFIELEGPGGRIREMADQLGFNWSRRILINYYGIFDIIRAQLALPFNDIAFDRFQGIDVDLSRYRTMMEAG